MAALLPNPAQVDGVIARHKHPEAIIYAWSACLLSRGDLLIAVKAAYVDTLYRFKWNVEEHPVYLSDLIDIKQMVRILLEVFTLIFVHPSNLLND